MSESDAKFLNWIADRFVHVHGESENVDFVLKLRELARLPESEKKECEICHSTEHDTLKCTMATVYRAPAEGILWPEKKECEHDWFSHENLDKDVCNYCSAVREKQPTAGIVWPSASELKEVGRKALEAECRCSIPHKKIRIIGDAIHAYYMAKIKEIGL